MQRPAAMDADAIRAALASAPFYVQSPITGEHFRAFVTKESNNEVKRMFSKVRYSTDGVLR
ncbi:MAG: hypothetical protein ACRYG2_07030 [Janthinobacterium lividum]